MIRPATRVASAPDRAAMRLPALPAPGPLRIRIGALGLPGLGAAAGARLADSFQQALVQRLLERSGAGASYTRHRLQLPRLPGRAGDAPELAGQRLAQLIAEALQQPGDEARRG